MTETPGVVAINKDGHYLVQSANNGFGSGKYSYSWTSDINGAEIFHVGGRQIEKLHEGIIMVQPAIATRTVTLVKASSENE